jgi:hypothetical protein
MSVKSQELTAKIIESGQTPLEYMLERMRDTSADYSERNDMAKAAAPYVHPKLAAIEHTGKDGGPIQHEDMTPLELARRVAFILNEGAREVK